MQIASSRSDGLLLAAETFGEGRPLVFAPGLTDNRTAFSAGNCCRSLTAIVSLRMTSGATAIPHRSPTPPFALETRSTPLRWPAGWPLLPLLPASAVLPHLNSRFNTLDLIGRIYRDFLLLGFGAE